MQTAMLVPEAVEGRQEALGDRLSELRVRPGGDGGVQAADAGAAGRGPRIRRAGGAARQDRARRRRAGAARCAARRDLLVAVRSRPRALRPRRPVARTVQGSPGVQPAGRRARVPRSAEGRGAGRLVCHRLPVVRDRHARAQAFPRCVPEEIQRLSAARLGRRLQRGRRRPPPRCSAQARPTRRSSSPRCRTCASTRRSAQ